MESALSFTMDILSKLWDEALYILPYLLVGVLLEATIRTFKWHVKLRHVLTRFGSLSVFVAAILGVASPLCACATLPLVISLLLAGLPLAPAVTLLITSPLMSPGGYVMLSAMLGPGWANVLLVSALLLGVFAGWITHLLHTRGFSAREVFRRALPEGDFHDADYPMEELRCACSEQLSHRVERNTGSRPLVFLAKLAEGSWKIGRVAMIGLLVEVVVSAVVPNDWVVALLQSDSIWPIFTLTFATIPLHLPQITAASMVFGLYLPDPGQLIPLARGPGIALLIGGPVTALPVMAVFLSMFKKRVFALYLGLSVGGTLLLALSYHFLPF